MNVYRLTATPHGQTWETHVGMYASAQRAMMAGVRHADERGYTQEVSKWVNQEPDDTEECTDYWYTVLSKPSPADMPRRLRMEYQTVYRIYKYPVIE